MGCTIIGCGASVPALEVTNDDLSRIVDTSDDWIVKRTGIRSRHIAVGESTTDLASQAAASAMGAPADGALSRGWSRHPLDPDSIDLVICATISPDAAIPSQAALVKQRLGLRNAIAFDVNAACSGCVYGVSVAEGLMAASCGGGVSSRNPLRRALVVGAERLSRLIDWTDRSTCVLFGDGAGAVALEWDDGETGIISTFLKNTDDGDLTLTCGTGRLPDDGFPFALAGASGTAEETSFLLSERYMSMEGREVFKFASAAIVEAIDEALARGGLGMEDVDLVVPHQANERIIAYAAKKMGLPLDMFQLSIGEYGNTSAASALMALCDAFSSGRIARGDHVVMVGFGGGLTSGSVLFRA